MQTLSFGARGPGRLSDGPPAVHTTKAPEDGGWVRGNASKPRVVHLADFGASYPGSFIPMLEAVSERLLARGWDVELVFTRVAQGRAWIERLESAGIKWRIVDEGSKSVSRRWLLPALSAATGSRWQTPLAREVRRIVAESPAPTVLHTHFHTFDLAAAQAVRRSGRVAVFWHIHDGSPVSRRRELGAPVRSKLLGPNVARLLCVDPQLPGVVSRYDRTGRHVFFPNAIDPHRFVPFSAQERTRARAQLGLPQDAHVVLHMGSHWHRKGGDLLLNAVQDLSQREPGLNIRAVVVGGPEARDAVSEAGLERLVAVVTPSEDVRTLYAVADVFVSPSRAEGMPLAILEALAQRIPVVASDIPGQAFIASATPACTVARLDARAIADAIRNALLTDPAAQAERTQHGREWVIREMSLDRWADALCQEYEHAIALLRTRAFPHEDQAARVIRGGS